MKIDWSKIEQPEIAFQRFPSRRSQVYGTKGVVASSQPLATEAGLEILRKGGNAGKLLFLMHSPRWSDVRSICLIVDKTNDNTKPMPPLQSQLHLMSQSLVAVVLEGEHALDIILKLGYLYDQRSSAMHSACFITQKRRLCKP